MTAYIRKQQTKSGSIRYFALEGKPENHRADTKIIGAYYTRRQAIRLTKQQGYEVIINGHLNAQQSVSESLPHVAEPERTQYPTTGFSWEHSKTSREGNVLEQLRFADNSGTVAESVRPYRTNYTQQLSEKGFANVQPEWGKPKSKDEADELKAILTELDIGVKTVFESDTNYGNYLKTLSTLYNYSYANTVLIAMQKPDATFVAGRKLWFEEFDRTIKDSNDEIKIIAPSAYTEMRNVERADKDGKPIYDDYGKPLTDRVEVTIPVFKVVSVYDISQTKGDRLPSLVRKEYSDVEKQNLEPLIEKYAQTYLQKSVLLQDNKKDSRTTQFEANSINYTLRHHFGLDNSAHTSPNAVLWSHGKSIKQIKSSLGAVQKECKSIISEVSNQRESLQKIQKENAPKTAQKSKSAEKPKTAKAPTQKKPSIRNELAAAKKQAATQKSAPSRSKSKAMELG